MDPVEEVYRTQHERLWRSLLAYTGDADLAAEAAAETFSQALGRGRELRDPAAWIWRTAFRVAAGMLQDRRRRPGPEIGGSATGETPLDGSLVEFLDQLSTLSQQQRAAVVLRYAGGFTPAEIADLLGTTSSTIRVQLHRAHAHLRQRIDER